MKLNMKYETTAAALALLIALSPAGFAQQSQSNHEDSSVIAAEESPAIAWSEMQTPQPAPSEKTTSMPDQQPEPQPSDSPAATPAQASGTQAQSDSATQTFTGTVIK